MTLARAGRAALVVGGAMMLVAGVASAAVGDPGPHARNRGTVKINGEPLDERGGNESQLACGELELRFERFDIGASLRWRFDGQPPSPREEISTGTVTISTDPQALILALPVASIPSDHHVKVTVQNVGSHAAGKHKAFWMRCSTVSAAKPPPVTPSATSSPPTVRSNTTPAPTPGTHVATPTATPTARVLGRHYPDPQLPRTGAGLRVLFLVGLAIAGTGAAMVLEASRPDPELVVSP